MIFGACQALILLHMMHDASHTSIGYGPTWWKVIGQFTMEWCAGAAFKSWYYQHVVGHHVYTNIMGSDPDLPVLEEGDLRYLVERQTWKQIYKYQHIYMPLLYGFLAIKFRIQDFTDTYFSRTNGPVRVNPIPLSHWINLWVTKAWFVFHRYLVPYYLGCSILGIPTSYILILEIFLYNLLADFVTGAFLAFNFQVSHISTAAKFPLSHEFTRDQIELEWAVSQVITSVDYAHGNPIVAFLAGALNYQTVHHLFPSVSQYHYPAIAGIIKRVCKKRDIPFNHIDTFSGALSAHIDYLRIMGTKKAMQ